jgi:hypothetical protein
MTRTILDRARVRGLRGVGSSRQPANRVGRLSKIASALDVPVTFFFDSEPKARRVAANHDVTFLSALGALRLIKAYDRMSPETRGHFAVLVEEIANTSRARAGAARRRSGNASA